MNLVLIKLILAHVLTDFVFQSDKWVEQKKKKGFRTPYFWLHVLLAGATTYLVLQVWSNWVVPAMIMVTHGFLDLWKSARERQLRDTANTKSGEDMTIQYSSVKNPRKLFVIRMFLWDQFLHMVVILIAWLMIIHGFDRVMPFMSGLFLNDKFTVIVTALVILIWPAGIIIDLITQPFRRELKSEDSLTRAGFYIGILERVLVFIFVISGQYEAIGFLIASKSILRITRDNDLEARKKTEYVLIGTLISFTVALSIGLGVKAAWF